MSKTYTVPRRLCEANIQHRIEFTGKDGKPQPWGVTMMYPDGLERGHYFEHLLPALHWLDQQATDQYPAYIPLIAKEPKELTEEMH